MEDDFEPLQVRTWYRTQFFVQHFDLKTKENDQAQISQGKNQQITYRALALKKTKEWEFSIYFSPCYQITWPLLNRDEGG